jgi:hypothetical protein
MLEKLPESLGEALHSQRAGIEHTVFHRLANDEPLAIMKVSSSAFGPGERIPVKYTADGEGRSPPLEWRGTPETAACAIVIVEDADSPTPHPLVHAIVVNLDVRESSLIEGALNSPRHEGIGLHTGRNSYLSQAWLPPDPPPGHGVHRYLFQVFALRSGARFSESPGRQEVFDAIAEHAVGAGCLLGTYERAERARAAQSELPEQEGMGDPSALVVPV